MWVYNCHCKPTYQKHLLSVHDIVKQWGAVIFYPNTACIMDMHNPQPQVVARAPFSRGLYNLKVQKQSTQARTARVMLNSHKTANQERPHQKYQHSTERTHPYTSSIYKNHACQSRERPNVEALQPCPSPHTHDQRSHTALPSPLAHGVQTRTPLNNNPKNGEKKIDTQPPGVTAKATPEKFVHKLCINKPAACAPPAQASQLQRRRGPQQ